MERGYMNSSNLETRKPAELALITGASMGLGEHFAHQLASRGVDVILTARSMDLLEKVASELREAGRTAWAFPCDLSLPDAPLQISRFLQENGLEPQWLINNAGFGDALPFKELSPERARAICDVNMSSLTELTARMLPILKKFPGRARIINVSSVAGFQPVPWFGVYSASKAYVLSFSEALYEELRNEGVRVTCLCPGYTATNFAKNNGLNKKFFTGAQSAEEVVRAALRGSDSGRAVVVTRNRLQIFGLRLMPRRVVRRVAGMVAKTYR